MHKISNQPEDIDDIVEQVTPHDAIGDSSRTNRQAIQKISKRMRASSKAKSSTAAVKNSSTPPLIGMGHVDMLEDRMVIGWALLQEDKIIRTATVELLLDGKFVTGAAANMPSEELKNSGFSDIFHGFKIEIPESYFNGEVHSIDVRIKEVDMLLQSEISQTFLPKRDFSNYQTAVTTGEGNKISGTSNVLYENQNNPETRSKSIWEIGKILANEISQIRLPEHDSSNRRTVESANIAEGDISSNKGQYDSLIKPVPILEGGKILVPVNEDSNNNPLHNTEGLLGSFDMLSRTSIIGWAWNRYEPHILTQLELWVDGKKHCCFTADMFCIDLKNRGIGSGNHAFTIDIPESYLDGTVHTFDIRFTTTGRSISNSPRSIITKMREGSMITCSIFYDYVLLKDGCIGRNFENAIQQNKKVAILCSYTPDGMCYGYHDYLKQTFTAAGFVPLIVHSAPDKGMTNESCFKSTDYYIIKRNEGYDFGSWIVGLYKIRHYLEALDEIILINDSVFGPLFDINPLLEKMRNSACDFWGIVDSYERAYHLQSFFLCFKRRILCERALTDFISQYSFPSEKSKAIEHGELGLSRFLIARGFVPAAAYYYRDLVSKWLGRIEEYVRKLNSFEENRLLTLGQPDREVKTEMSEAAQFISTVSRSIRSGDPLNPMHFFWDILLEDQCPYIKRELLFKNMINHPFHFEIISALKNLSDYPVELIYECAIRYGTNKVI